MYVDSTMNAITPDQLVLEEMCNLTFIIDRRPSTCEELFLYQLQARGILYNRDIVDRS
jgi:hypothetical protein